MDLRLCILQGFQRLLMNNSEIQNLSEGANEGRGRTAGAKRVWGQNPQRPAIFRIFQ